MKQRTMFLTTYALTSGIFKFKVTGDPNPSGAMWGSIKGGYGQYIRGRDLCATLAEAKQRALVMRDKKVASLRKQIAKLEALTLDDIKLAKE